MIAQAGPMLTGLLTEGAEQIDAAMAHAMTEAALQDKPAKYAMAFQIVRDFQSNKWSWKLSWSERHTLGNETSAKDPNQIEMGVA